MDAMIFSRQPKGIAIPVAPKEFSLSCAVDVNESPSEEEALVAEGRAR